MKSRYSSAHRECRVLHFFRSRHLVRPRLLLMCFVERLPPFPASERHGVCPCSDMPTQTEPFHETDYYDRSGPRQADFPGSWADADGTPIFNRKLRRAPARCGSSRRRRPVWLEWTACGSAHYWAREISALGHDVLLIPPLYVKLFGKARQDRRGRRRSDQRGGDPQDHALRAVAKSADQQAAAVAWALTRAKLVNQRTQVINALRAHLSEFGIIAAAGTARARG